MSLVLPLDSLALDIACPYCGELTADYVGELRASLSITCDGCGKVLPLDPSTLEKQIAELDAKRFEVAAAFEQLRSMGKK